MERRDLLPVSGAPGLPQVLRRTATLRRSLYRGAAAMVLGLFVAKA
jgi:hypothetical protein